MIGIEMGKGEGRFESLAFGSTESIRKKRNYGRERLGVRLRWTVCREN